MQEEAIYEEVDEQQDPIPKPKKLKVKDFAAKIKQKYPDYKDVDDLELTNKIIAKYPVYKDQVDFTVETIKKKWLAALVWKNLLSKLAIPFHNQMERVAKYRP